MYYYKVVKTRKVGSRTYLESAVAENKIRYFKTKWTTAPLGTKIFVFNNSYSARVFCRRNPSFEVWVCSVVGIEYLAPVKWASDIEAFWQARNSGQDTARFDRVGNLNAWAATKIKLLNKIA